MGFESRIKFEAPGGRCDVTPVFTDPAAFADMLERMRAGVRSLDFGIVAGIDALGFILGAALAVKMGKGFLPIRKGGKLPVPSIKSEFKDYTGQVKTLELAVGAVAKGARILLVDDWIETGAQVKAAISLIEAQGGKVIAVEAIHVDTSGAELGLGDMPCLALLKEKG